MVKKADRSIQRTKKHMRIRNKISGTAERPRLSVYKSNMHIYAQLIDDINGNTIASASTVDKDLKVKVETTSNVAAAKLVGELVAKRGVEKGIEEVVFDRGGYVYHGRVKAVAEAARENGLKF